MTTEAFVDGAREKFAVDQGALQTVEVLGLADPVRAWGGKYPRM